jgi:hypothetical protein
VGHQTLRLTPACASVSSRGKRCQLVANCTFRAISGRRSVG